jgi:hypothetical protein
MDDAYDDHENSRLSLSVVDDLDASIGRASMESSVYPREAMIEDLQQKTMAALEYQLFDRLNNGDYDEV